MMRKIKVQASFMFWVDLLLLDKIDNDITDYGAKKEDINIQECKEI